MRQQLEDLLYENEQMLLYTKKMVYWLPKDFLVAVLDMRRDLLELKELYFKDNN